MSVNSPPPAPSELAFFASPPHECSYLPDRKARTLFVDPYARHSPELYEALTHLGFRRSGSYVYRTQCPECDACKAVRIRVHDFRPNRSQQRVWRQNQDLRAVVTNAHFSDEHFALYRRYMGDRHPGGGMDVDDPRQYRQFLIGAWSATRFVEFRQAERLLAVAVVDELPSGLSAVYTFFDPDEPKRALGVYAILWEIAEAARLGLEYAYLGYWIAESPKMAYKQRYQPQEIFDQGEWRPNPPSPPKGPRQ